MASKPETTASSWPKFDWYAVEKGYLGPLEGAMLTAYDSWAELRDVRSREGVTDAPYQSLLRLPAQLGLAIDRFATETPGDFNEVSLSDNRQRWFGKWLSRHGLLGLLPQCYRQINLPIIARLDQLGGPRPTMQVVFRIHVRMARGWMAERTSLSVE